MISKKRILVLFLLLITVTTLSAVSASDLNDDAISEDMGSDFEEIELDENNDMDDTKETKTLTDASKIISKEDASNDVINSDEWRTFSELQELINDADENSTLNLDYNYYYNDDFDDYLTIDKDLTIDGRYHNLDACYKKGIFFISANEVTIKNLNLLNSEDYGPGAAVYFSGGEATFINCIFVNNTVGSQDELSKGGAIYTKGTLYVVGCQFYDNFAIGSGGAIYADNDLAFISDCRFINNDAWENGGGIVATGKLFINYTYFQDNDATENGGAVYAYYPDNSNVSTLIINSYFYYNYALTGNGGALYLDALESGDYIVNGAAETLIANTGFEENVAGYGGAIFNFQHTDISDCDFIKNKAREGGGAIYMNNGIYFNDGSNDFYQTFGLEIHGKTTFTNNTAARYGGAIKIYANPVAFEKGIKGVLKIYGNVVFEENSVTNGTGGALSIIDSDSSVKNAVFRKNTAKTAGAVEGGSVTDCTFEGNSKPETVGTEIKNSGGNNNGNNGGQTPDSGIPYDNLKTQVIFISNPLYTSYGSGQSFEVKVIDSKTGSPISGFTVMLKVYTGGNYIAVPLTTNANGVAQYTGASTLSIGSHNVVISNGQTGLFSAVDQSSSITVSKGSYTIVAPAIKKAYKKSGTFKITVKNKAGQVMKGVKLSVKVYTGKKSKTYNIKTNAKGVASIKTKSLSKGKHKVAITAKGTALYNDGKKTSKITVK